MTADERPLSDVPPWLWGALFAALATQLAWRAARLPGAPTAAGLPPAPRPEVLPLASFGEPEAAARLAMLHLQSFDLGGANALPYRKLDYARLIDWLGAILALDPRSDYPLFSAARVYAEVPDPARNRGMPELVYPELLRDPNPRCSWASAGTVGSE